MRSGRLMLWLGLATGVGFWLVDAALDCLFFRNATFWECVAADVSPHEVYIRTTVLLILAAFGVVVARVLGARARTFRQLEESERTLQSIFRAAPIGIGMVRERVLCWVNDAFVELTGYARSEIEGKSARLLYPSDAEFERVGREKYAEIRASGRGCVETRWVRKDGRVRDVLLSSSSLAADEPESAAVFTAIDVTEEFRTRDLMEAVLRDSQDAILVKDEAGRYRLLSDAACRALGRPEEELLGRTDEELFPPEIARQLSGTDREVLETGTHRTEEITVQGSPRPTVWRVAKVPRRDGRGRITGVIGVGREISEEKESEAVRQAIFRIVHAAAGEASLGRIFETMHQALGELMPVRNFYIALLDEPAGVLRFPYFVDQFDSAPEPIARDEGLTGLVILRDRPLRFDLDSLREAERTGDVRRRGREATAWLGVPLKTGDRVVGAMVVQSYEPGAKYGEREEEIFEIVSTQVGMVLARAVAEESRRELAAMVEQTTDVIIMTGVDGTIHYVNPAFERVTGYSPGEAIGRNVRMLQGGENEPGALDEMWATLREGKVWTGRFVNRHRDGSIYYMDATVGPLRDGEGRLTGYVSSQRDVTRELRLSEELRQAQKMEAVGRLAGGIAHDFNNLLTAIGGYADMIRRRLPEDDPLRGKVEPIRTAADRAAKLTRQLLAFSRKQVLRPRVLDPNAVVAGMEGILRRLIGEDVELSFELSEDLGHVRADAGQLEQVLMNLAVNARDAMPTGGKLRITTANVDLDEPGDSDGNGSGPYVRLSVIDSGIGMDAETLSRVFEPFFTTKGREEGTGLGLSTVYGIVRQSRGMVRVESEPDEGSSFSVFLPRIDAPLDVEIDPPEQGGSGGTETVLLVEDDPGVRDLTEEVLAQGGYTVLSVASGEEALEVADAHDGRISLLLTDVVLPGIGGGEVARRMTERHPGMRIIFMSGYSDDAIARHGVLQPGTRFLEKPFPPEALARAVREVLDG